MRAVLLTGQGLEQTYVANTLIERLGSAVVGIVIEEQTPKSLRQAVRRYGVWRLGERVATKIARRLLRHDARQDAALRRVLGPIAPARWLETIPSLRPRSVNVPDALAFLARMQPTHLFVYGTSIVGRRVLAIPSAAALNMHTGLSPWYRGADTIFWPLYVGDPNRVGVTVHACTADLDGGDVYARATVPLQPDDDPFLAFARGVQRGAALYADVGARLAAGDALQPEPQDHAIGRLYRFTDRTLWHELVMEAKVRTGALRRVITQ